MFEKLAAGKPTVREWTILLKVRSVLLFAKRFDSQTLRALVDIGDALRSWEVSLPVLGKGEQAMGKELARMCTLLDKSFNLAESTEEQRFVVSAGISEELDECAFCRA